MRGRGISQIQITKRRLLKPKSFVFNFKYSQKPGDGESVVVISTDYHKAMKEAFQEKRDPREPIEVEVIDPDLGRILRTIGKGAAKAAKLGIKYSYAGAKVLGKEAAMAVATSYRELKLKRLIGDAYSVNRTTRIMARAKLRTQYPEIYKICDFSKEKN